MTKPYPPRAFRFNTDEALVAKIMPEVMWDWPWSRTFLAEGPGANCLGAVLLVEDVQGVRALVRSAAADLALERTLLAEACTIARRRGFMSLRAWEAVAVDSAAALTWEELGFTLGPVSSLYEVGLPEYLGLLRPYLERLRAAGQVPASVQVLSLDEAPRARVAELHTAELGGDPERFSHFLRLPHEQGGFHLQKSKVLVHGAEVIAICLVRPDGERAAMVDSVVVHPRWRQGWAGLLVQCACAEHGLRDGYAHLHFMAGEQHVSTHKQAQRAKGRLLARLVTPYCGTGNLLASSAGSNPA